MVVGLLIYAVAALLSVANAGGIAPSPAPTSDGTSVDQAIGYVLMLLALVLTYIIH